MRTAAFVFSWLLAVASAFAATPQLCSGRYHSLALRSDGRVLASGSDAYGQLGQGRLLLRSTPARVTNLSGIRAVSSRNGGTVLALGSDGHVYAWGDNEYGELGGGTLQYYGNGFVVSNIGGIVAISAGGLHSMALSQDGSVWTWGDNSRGQLGDGSTANRSLPGVVSGLANVIAISAGSGYSVALKSDGTVWAWGANLNGQVGIGTTSDVASPRQVVNLTGVTAISAGEFTTLALRSDGTVWGWGSNSQGQVGDGTSIDRLAPVQLPGLAGVRAISEGDFHGAALRNDGTVWIWGINQQGQLGNGSYDALIHTASQVPGLSGVVEISAGSEYTLAIRNDGALLAWGRNTYGELGFDASQYAFVNVPSVVPGIAGATSVNAGYDVSFAISSGTVFGWGKNNYQQLASGPTNPDSQTTPALVPGLTGVAAIACSRYSSFALKDDGSLWTWGANDWGVLGDGTLVPRSSPVRATGLPALASVSASYSSYNADDGKTAHVLAVDRTGGVWAWGSNWRGELGNGILTFSNGNIYYAATPVSLSSPRGVSSVAAGAYHSLALDAQGRIWAWGDNDSGELGDGTTVQRNAPVAISGLSSVTQVAAGWAFSLAVTADRRAWAWGDSSGGELGTGATANQPTPTPMLSLSDVRFVSAGADQGLAILGDGSLWSWGYNAYGAIGDGTLDERDLPVRIASAGAVSYAVAGNQFTLAAIRGGAALAWGNNGNGQLGDGTLANRTQPQLMLGVNGVGFLNLSPENALQVPADKVPPFSVVASGSTSSAAANVTANILYRSQDVGSSGSVYVFAMAPAGIVKGAAATKQWRPRPIAKGAMKDAVSCVLAQLTPSGQLTAASASSLQAYTSGVLSSQGQAVTVLNGVPTANVAGATFYVGYGPSATTMLNNGTDRSIVSVPGSAQCLDTSSPAPAASAPGALSGLWWNSGESGWGIHFTQRSNIIFAAWYTYNASGNPKWYVSTCTMPSGTTGTTGTCNGTLYEVNGPAFFGTAFNPALANAVNAGALQVNFQNADTASMTYSGVAGQTRTVAITRQALAAGSTPPAVNYTDIWWNPNESGWGMAITQQFSTMFLAWYVYDGAGKPIWYVATCTFSGTTCSGDLLRTTGPAFGPTFNSNQVQVFTAGTVGVNFTDGNNATLSYTVNGASASKVITRQVF